MGVAGVVKLSRKWKSGPMTSRSPNHLGFRFPRETISYAVWLYDRAPQQAAGKMTEARQNRLSGAGFKPVQAAGIKIASRERWGRV